MLTRPSAVFAGASCNAAAPLHANLLTRVPKRAQPGVATMVRTIYQQLLPPGPRPIGPSGGTTPGATQVAELLADAAPDILAFTAFPVTGRSCGPQNGPGDPSPDWWWASSPTGRRAATGGQTRRGRSPPLPRRRQRGTFRTSGLINIKRDDVLHLLTGHYRLTCIHCSAGCSSGAASWPKSRSTPRLVSPWRDPLQCRN